MSFAYPKCRRLSRTTVHAACLGLGATFLVLIITGLSGALLYVRGVRALKEEVRASLIRTATVAAALVDSKTHQSFTTPKQETTAAYFKAIKPLAQVQQADGDIKYIYTCILRQGKVYFVLDPTPPGDHNGDGVDEKSHIMQPYSESPPAMLAALREGRPEADAEPVRDDWGMLISGYAPIRDAAGNSIGIVGVDLAADRYMARLASMRRAAASGAALASGLALGTGLAVFGVLRRMLQAEESRFQVMQSLHRTQAELEARVLSRTADLADANNNLADANGRLNEAYDATIEALSRALDYRDRETQGHSERVMMLTLRLARTLGCTEESLTQIRRGALLHDIGKIGVPDSILHKPGPLTEEERALMCRHTGYAREMLSPIVFLRPALEIPYCHHEKWDGSGYPQGLAGDEIPLPARLFALVDVWDALSSDRPYRAAWPQAKVYAHIESLAGAHFDPALVSVFLHLLETEGGTLQCREPASALSRAA